MSVTSTHARVHLSDGDSRTNPGLESTARGEESSDATNRRLASC